MERSFKPFAAALVAALVSAGCGSRSANDGSHPASTSTGAAAGPATASSKGATGSAIAPATAIQLTGCPPAAAAAAAAAPQSIAAFIDFVNALPHPVTLPCLLAALPHPLSLAAGESMISVQPSSGPNNPRIFIGSGNLMITAVTSGTMAQHLEFGEMTSESRSIKGDLQFPVNATLPPQALYANVLEPQGGGTQCGSFCHSDEKQEATVGGVASFSSIRLRPNPGYTTSIDDLRSFATACAGQTDDRCQIFQALFTGGDPTPYAFPPDLQTL